MLRARLFDAAFGIVAGAIAALVFGASLKFRTALDVALFLIGAITCLWWWHVGGVDMRQASQLLETPSPAFLLSFLLIGGFLVGLKRDRTPLAA
jgi:hypothetical protein